MNLGILIVAILAVLIAVGLAWIPARMLVFAIARTAASHVQQWVKRKRDRRKVPRGTPDRRKSWNPEAPEEESETSEPNALDESDGER